MIASHFSQHRDRLAQISQRFHARAIFAPNFFLNRDVTFVTVQVIVQMIAFLSGILLIRMLEQREYAFFTIANTMQGTLNLLADIGISVGLVSIGGRVWQDRPRFSQLVSTALYLRRRLALLAMIAVTPVLYFMLAKNGASSNYTALLTILVLVGLAIQLDVGVLGVIPRLRGDIGVIQRIDLIGAIVRLTILVLLVFIFLNAGIAVTVSTVVIFLQYLLLRRYSATVIDFGAPPNAEDRKAMRGLIRSQAANAVFYCFQGQITIFLISFFARQSLSRQLPFRPLLRFLYVYVWQKGFLDGAEGYYFAQLHGFYEFLSVAKTRELLKQKI